MFGMFVLTFSQRGLTTGAREAEIEDKTDTPRTVKDFHIKLNASKHKVHRNGAERESTYCK